jgi:cellulose synthase/poly-beta-1,6-N-acetylglucosamine synthase-like glycosyltransferase
VVSIICCTMRQNFMENVFQNYDNQVWMEKELIIILNKDDMDITKWKERAKQSQGVSVYQLPEETYLGECLNYGIDKAKYDFIAKFDDDDYYAPNYIKQSMKALKEMNADIVGKATIYMYFEASKSLAIHRPGRENKYITKLKGATLLFKKQIMEKVRFPKKNMGEDAIFVKQCKNQGFILYSTDRCNYACLRTSKSGHHTWGRSTEWLMERSYVVGVTDNYKSLVQCPEVESEDTGETSK